MPEHRLQPAPPSSADPVNAASSASRCAPAAASCAPGSWPDRIPVAMDQGQHRLALGVEPVQIGQPDAKSVARIGDLQPGRDVRVTLPAAPVRAARGEQRLGVREVPVDGEPGDAASCATADTDVAAGPTLPCSRTAASTMSCRVAATSWARLSIRYAATAVTRLLATHLLTTPSRRATLFSVYTHVH